MLPLRVASHAAMIADDADYYFRHAMPF